MSHVAPMLSLSDTATGVAAADELLLAARASVRERVAAAKDDAQQATLHGYAWLATYVEAIRQLQAWAERLSATGRFGAMEQGILAVGMGEYLAQISGGIAMSQVETVRLASAGRVRAADIAKFNAKVEAADRSMGSMTRTRQR